MVIVCDVYVFFWASMVIVRDVYVWYGMWF